MLLVFVTLFAVTGVAYAETKTECRDKAYSTFNYCLRFFEEVKAMGDLDLYSSWEIRDIQRQIDTCVRFNRNESRYQACVDRLVDEAVEQVVDKTIQDMDPEERKKLENSGPVTIPPQEGSESPLHFASKLEARRDLLGRLVRGAIESAMEEMQQKQQGIDKEGTIK